MTGSLAFNNGEAALAGRTAGEARGSPTRIDALWISGIRDRVRSTRATLSYQFKVKSGRRVEVDCNGGLMGDNLR